MIGEGSVSTGSLIHSHSLAINGTHLNYKTWGQFSRAERVVFLVHGLTNSSQAWSEFGPILAANGWFVVAPDLRGRGWSGRPSHGYGIPYNVNDLLALADALGLQQVHYVGHSLGALIGYFFAAMYPQRLSSLVAIDAGARPAPHLLDAIQPVLDRLGRVYPSLDVYLQTMRTDSAAVHPWSDFWEAYYRYEAEVRRDGTVTLRAHKAAIEEEMTINTSINNDVLLPAIKAPTLILWAGEGTRHPDWLVLTEEEARRMQGLIKGSRVELIPDGNHYTIILSEVFKRRVLAFLADVKSPATV